MESAFWSTAFGAAAGVVAGVLVQFGFNWIQTSQADKRIRRSIAKECGYNLLVVADIEEAFRRFRNAVNGDAPETGQTYAPFNNGLHVQVNNLASSGRLYEFFDDANLKRVQAIVSNLSAVNGEYFLNQLERRKTTLIEGTTPGAKAETIAFLNFADGKVGEIKEHLVELQTAFRKKTH